MAGGHLWDLVAVVPIVDATGAGFSRLRRVAGGPPSGTTGCRNMQACGFVFTGPSEGDLLSSDKE
jgi:hypothetical protein